MTNQSTMDKLIEMRMTAMSDAFRTQIEDSKMKDIPFEDRFGMLVDIEYSNRKSNSLKRLIRNAGFDQPEAYIGDINYTSGRKLNRMLIERLATCEYITEHQNIFITGATGSGKTYISCAFGMEACKQRFKTNYVRLPDLLLDLEIARNDGNYRKAQGKYANPVLLIIDEWLLLKPTETEQHDILELLHRRQKNRPPSSVHSMIRVAGMISLVAMKVLLQRRSSTVSSTMPEYSALQILPIRNWIPVIHSLIPLTFCTRKEYSKWGSCVNDKG